MLRVINLTKHFGGVAAVQDCTFEVPKNKITALIGPNGAGKSTVFNLVSGIVPEDYGEIWLGERNITHLSASARARQGLARTFQHVRLFRSISVRENIALAQCVDDDRFFSGVVWTDKNKSTKPPEHFMQLVGLDAPPDRDAGDLSYGQSKLLELARALAFPHSVLMLDEPVAGVNPVLRDALKILLRRLRDEQHETILVVEHDMDFVMNVADHVIVMDQGTVLAEGTPQEIQKNKEVLEAYLGV